MQTATQNILAAQFWYFVRVQGVSGGIPKLHFGTFIVHL